MDRVIHWFRRDLRISDNTALWHAARDGEEVIPVYILSTWKGQHRWTGSNRQAFLCGCLESLVQEPGGNWRPIDYARRGSGGGVGKTGSGDARRGDLFRSRFRTPTVSKSKKQLKTVCEKLQIKLFGYKDITIFEPDEILTREGRPFRVFTPYAKAWHLQEKPALLPRIRALGTPTTVFESSSPDIGLLVTDLRSHHC